jgi:hypothetical protein
VSKNAWKHHASIKTGDYEAEEQEGECPAQIALISIDCAWNADSTCDVDRSIHNRQDPNRFSMKLRSTAFCDTREAQEANFPVVEKVTYDCVGALCQGD